MATRERVAKYRRLQAWYREHQLQIAEPGIGVNGKPVPSMLPAALVKAQPTLNFLTPAAFRHAERRIVEVRAEGGTLEEDRLRRNLLSSMPLCFNVFGGLGTHPAFPSLLQTAGIDDVRQVDEVTCEWAPRPTAAHLGDRSAFDALVRYRTGDGSPRFIGVETKYTETFSPAEYEREEYLRVTEESGWFKPGAGAALVGSATNQLWRTVMLAASVERIGESGRGCVLVLTLADDVDAATCVAVVRSQLTDESRLHHVTYEALTDASRSTDDRTSWHGRVASVLATWMRTPSRAETRTPPDHAVASTSLHLTGSSGAERRSSDPLSSKRSAGASLRDSSAAIRRCASSRSTRAGASTTASPSSAVSRPTSEGST